MHSNPERRDRANVRLISQQDDILECRDILSQLVSEPLREHEFLEQVLVQIREGYFLATLKADDKIVTVAGFRMMETLSWGKIMFLDDLVTDKPFRSRGFGGEMMEWLLDYAKKNSCTEIHLDSGVQRCNAHRFYERFKMVKICYHFSLKI